MIPRLLPESARRPHSAASAHFGHEFRAFTGLTPTRYVEARRRFLRERPGHVLDGWPLPPIDLLQERKLTTR